jgi:hypothetical protein
MYRLNLIMRNYLDNQRELINTHKQYLELNNLYQKNITAYMNTILSNNVMQSDNTDDVLSNATYNLSDNVDNDSNQDNQYNADTVNHGILNNTDVSNTDVSTTDVSNTDVSTTDVSNTDVSNTDVSNNTDDNIAPTPFERTMQEHNVNIQSINDSIDRRRRNRRRRLPTVNTQYTGLNRQHLVSPTTVNDYHNTLVPTVIINQECDIIPYNSLNTTQDMCPIDRLEFEENEPVMRIRFCGHIFRENNLRENFRSRATCPVCRHNIITTVTDTNYQRNNPSHNIDWFIRY